MEAYVVLIIQGKFRWHVANRGCDWREAHTSWLVSHSPIVTSDLARQGKSLHYCSAQGAKPGHVQGKSWARKYLIQKN